MKISPLIDNDLWPLVDIFRFLKLSAWQKRVIILTGTIRFKLFLQFDSIDFKMMLIKDSVVVFHSCVSLAKDDNFSYLFFLKEEMSVNNKSLTCHKI